MNFEWTQGVTRNGFGMDWCISESMGDTIIILFAGERGYYCSGLVDEGKVIKIIINNKTNNSL